MRGGLVIETLTHLALALTTIPAVALSIFFVFGAHAFIWGTTSSAVRQRAVPTHVQGRVQSVYMIGVTGGIVVGSVIGGLLADQWGVTAPFWFAFVGSGIILALIWRQLTHIAHADEEIVEEAALEVAQEIAQETAEAAAVDRPGKPAAPARLPEMPGPAG
jgi:predicted MFS family arabinose efflux permease